MRIAHILPAVVLAAYAVTGLLANEPNEQDSDRKALDDRAQHVLQQWSQQMAELEQFSFSMSSSMKVSGPGMNMEMHSAQEVNVQKPNRLAVVSKGERSPQAFDIVFDGQNVSTYFAALNQYTVEAEERALDDLADHPLLAGLGGGGGIVLTALVSNQPSEHLLQPTDRMEYVGRSEFDDVVCHQLRFEMEGLHFDLWLEASEPPRVRGFVPDMRKSMEAQLEQAELEGEHADLFAQLAEMEYEVKVRFTDWNLAPELGEQDFTFDPPAGAQQVDSLFSFSIDEEEPSSLIGEAAPQFALEMLDGSTAKLADHVGKDVVILDFWASWCGPCRRGLPALANVFEAYRDRDVAFYAVNLEEEKETIQDFLDQMDLDIPVLLDKDGDVGRRYQASAIPQTVLIGKDGRVHVVHVGLIPELEERLKTEVDALLEGKDLAAETLADQNGGEN